jgi:DNA-directed RNA polymerase subunit beta'
MNFVPVEVGYVNALLTKKSLREIIGDIIKITNVPKTAKFLDEIKNFRFPYGI